MKNLLSSAFLLLSIAACQNTSQSPENTTIADTPEMTATLPDTLLLSKAYNQYKESRFAVKRFKHQEVESLLHQLAGNDALKLHKLGESVQKRNIYQVEFGTGHKKVMLWSQMHGDESTATMAIFDILNFLGGSNDEFDTVRTLIRSNLHLYFIPMLNPDGAEIFSRRNAMGIDINRDARSGTTPEGKILIQAAKTIAPQYAFNLHDQQPYYAAGFNQKPATISFLAPAYNYERDTNQTRADAMRLIVGMNRLLQQYIEGGVAKYDDAHEPRGFGDNFQKWGASTILIESGGYPNDPEKQYIRRLNFLIILNGLIDIATNNYQKYNVDEYAGIPDNRVKINDLLIRNITFKNDTLAYKTDLAINQDQYSLDSGRYYLRGRVEDVGDLQESNGYHELNADGLTFTEGKFYEKTFKSIDKITPKIAYDLIKAGYYGARIEEVPKDRRHFLPLLILKNAPEPGGGMHLGMPANFFLTQNGNLRYAVINGYLIDLNEEPKDIYNQYIR